MAKDQTTPGTSQDSVADLAPPRHVQPCRSLLRNKTVSGCSIGTPTSSMGSNPTLYMGTAGASTSTPPDPPEALTSNSPPTGYTTSACVSSDKPRASTGRSVVARPGDPPKVRGAARWTAPSWRKSDARQRPSFGAKDGRRRQ